ncbi:bifunctional DNA-binding transcriptional regulator/O6-methylguanine-DNA methyltransferase Ada [Roseospira visakhapatnamensis]|uniref:methylated-DNA--[protein]-cysteine S-methyltransferase n=1 Tax=Roseospira visakhapatnamensis TaxID=390880 RepID=A0A7W6WAE1_9PROT|nr:bifunctional DNA-binding transcriptional regulator/O6-methylguanine-DNA methyltransferase Ada [Roseospira visakhapatnamensis]MBB4266391.1 AraC family transcriptional regulator of adaptative response/methylated-DNA-[protein]-cysteine methyltransferase [Roseospira visakhapatnamensis]
MTTTVATVATAVAPVAPDEAEELWRAVVERRPLDDRSFFYGVTSTRIVCRPGCPSRRPARANVRFFDTVDAARTAGYRPCKRCRPDEPAGQGVRACLERACHRLATEEEEPSLAALAAEAGLSPAHFQRVFKAGVGVSPKGYARAARATRLKAALNRGERVTDAIYEAGFGGPAPAHAVAREHLGMPPSAWRAGGAGQVIRHAQADSDLGRVLVAATARGLCDIAFGDDDEALRAGLRARFPKATLEPADDSFAEAVAAVLALIEQPARGLDLPLDVQGTLFQRRVWDALRAIPAGETVSYAEVAARIGRPNATRAVAGACAANRLAVAVPCHRVVAADGGLSGYRWGPDRKRALLDREAEGRDAENMDSAPAGEGVHRGSLHPSAKVG